MGTLATLSKQLLYCKTASHKTFCLMALLYLLSMAHIEAQQMRKANHPVTINPQRMEDTTGGFATHFFEIKTDTIDFHISGNELQVLEDNTGKLTFEQVSHTPLIDSFHLNNLRKYNFSAYAFWFRFRLKNVMDHEEDICLTSSAEYTDYYIGRADGTWQHFQTGKGVPRSKIEGIKSLLYITLSVDPGEELLIYRRDRNNNSYVLPADFDTYVYFKDKVIQDAYIVYKQSYSGEIANVLLAGILILAAFFNFFFYRSGKDKVYLYFAMFVLFYGILKCSNALFVIFFWQQPRLFDLLQNVPGLLYVFSIVNFIRYYFETHLFNRKWDRILIVVAFAFCLPTIANVFLSESRSHFWNSIWDDIWDLNFHLVYLFFFLVCIIYLRQKNAIRSKVIPALPVLFFWGICFTCVGIYSLLNRYLQVPFPQILDSMMQWQPLIELVCLSWLVLFFSWSLFQRYQQLQKQIAFESAEKERMAKEKEIERSQLIAQQKIELEKTVEERTSELKHSLNELKSTQAQLIQSEKMASLGELTAGIAHEIQNPLNFVNNFSEVNNELIDEMNNENDINEIKAIANDIKQNNEKISMHGKRADAIVKGMLQHSRTSTGQKEPTDINSLCDEYLRLAYHGLRAKDKSFNAKFETDFDPSIGKINIVPQDIGRVLLNLINNAFYAVSEKQKTANEKFDPCVSVQTKKLNHKIEIVIKDNGNGIPRNIVDKIFQPFFTTKPTGQGTGLGLSLAYDIVKAHGGEIKVETMESRGSEFIIQLPDTNH